jgi:hypothetical protein
MNAGVFPWTRLGIAPTADTGAIRKAYADALRAIDPDADIAGFAELRRARDEALWLAAHGERDEPEEEGDHGLGDWGDDAAEAGDDSPAALPPDPVAPVDPGVMPERSEAQQRAEAAWNALVGVLYPEGTANEEAVTHAELAEGLAALETLIARAEEADLAEHDALDSGLAELFASTWPRSAPFVEPANAAFHWLGESGHLEERWALRFLNQRLKGMRFHEKVQQADHPLNRAWVELSRPGRAGWRDRLRVKRLDVHKLLTGIRERYPELEAHLDPDRVASWDGGSANPGEGRTSAGRGFVGALAAVLLVFALARVVASLMAILSPGEDAPSPVADAAQIDAGAAAIFGSGMGMAAVRTADPAFAEELELVLGRAEIRDGLDLVRLKALGAAEVADADALAVGLDLKALWLAAARRRSDRACRLIARGDFRGPELELTGAERAREQALLRQLLEARVLGVTPKGGETRYAVPGWLAADTLRLSGLTEEALVAALADPDSPDRCRAESALIAAVRAAPGRVPVEVLKGL